MILLHEPNLKGKEKKNLNECINTNWISTSGKFIDAFEKQICKITNSKYAIAVNSGTSALHISLILSNVKSNDEVIIPTVGFIAPVNAIRYCGANPVFMDVDEYLNIDVKKTIKFIEEETLTKNNITYNKKTNKKISALIVIHIFGNLVDINKLKNICEKKNIKLIEDAAESFGSYYKSHNKKKITHAGTIGRFGCLSFNGNKIITTGGGGAILTQNKSLAKKARYLISQAKDDPIYFVHNEVGYNYKMSNLHAAVGLAQINNLKKILNNKKKIYNFYCKEISSIKGLSILDNPKYCHANHWLNLVKLKKNSFRMNRDNLIRHLNNSSIQVRPVWKLNHLQKPFVKFQRYKISNAKKFIDSMICLPSSSNLKMKDLMKIVKLIKN